MTHGEFVAAYRAGSIRVNVDPAAAGAFMSRRLWLPLVRLPVLGVGVALALSGWLWTGFALIGLGTLAPTLIKRSAPRFIVTQALGDRGFYEDVVREGVLQVLSNEDVMMRR